MRRDFVKTEPEPGEQPACSGAIWWASAASPTTGFGMTPAGLVLIARNGLDATSCSAERAAAVHAEIDAVALPT